jgi:histidinol-phosphate aminotransferase
MLDFGHDLKAMRAAVTDHTRLMFVASPNNPTGMANLEADLIELTESLPEHVILCLDEAYAEYLESAPDLGAQIAAGRKVFCLRTFSKIYGLGGLRVGYGYGDPQLIQLLQGVRQPFNVSGVAQAAATAALSDHEFVEMCRSANEAGRKQLVEGMEALGYPTIGGQANFVLSKVGAGGVFFKALQKRGIIVRPLAPYGMAEFVRITIGTVAENERLLEAAREIAQNMGVSV